ncbi:MAG: hypothetical protein OXI22_10935 [Defluviicoccus sp.]|nr:hypothetical protein [Defluviicoccus sp.]
MTRAEVMSARDPERAHKSYSSFSEALQPLAARMPQVVREREILRLAATLGNADGDRTELVARQEILKWAEKRTGGRLPQGAWMHEEFEHLAGGRNCGAVRIVDDSRDIWAIRADDPDKGVAQRVWTTEAIVGHKPGQRPLLSVRLLVSSPEQELRIEPAVPGLVHQLESKCELYQGIERLDPEPWVIRSEDDVDRLIDTLIDPTRRIPVLVLSVPKLSADPARPLIDPSPIARATLAIAVVVVLPAQFTWVLTERFGKRLSVFGGAVRVYLPGFAEDANPYGGHDLVLADRLSTAEGVANISAWLRRVAATESIRRLRLGQDVLSYAAVRRHSLDATHTRLEQEGASYEEQLTVAQVQIDTLKKDLETANEMMQLLSDDNEAVEIRARSAEAQLTAAGYRIQQLLEQIKTGGETPDASIALPSSWDGFADWCDQNLVGRVLLSPRARREVRAPQFKDVSAAARCLLWLANEYRERRLNGGDGDLRTRIESGIQNDRCGADAFQIDWQGGRAAVDWHIKNGGNTRDPARCLRIYYFWDEASQQVVIASMPTHLRTGAT